MLCQLHENRQKGFLDLFELKSAGVFTYQENEGPITGVGTREDFGDSVDDLQDLLPAGAVLSDLNRE